MTKEGTIQGIALGLGVLVFTVFCGYSIYQSGNNAKAFLFASGTGAVLGLIICVIAKNPLLVAAGFDRPVPYVAASRIDSAFENATGVAFLLFLASLVADTAGYQGRYWVNLAAFSFGCVLSTVVVVSVFLRLLRRYVFQSAA